MHGWPTHFRGGNQFRTLQETSTNIKRCEAALKGTHVGLTGHDVQGCACKRLPQGHDSEHGMMATVDRSATTTIEHKMHVRGEEPMLEETGSVPTDSHKA